MSKRTLILWRHAKSGGSGPEPGDFGRTLAERGRRAAPVMAAMIAERLPAPDLILCSPARRTRETLAALQTRLSPETPVRFPDTIYEAAPETLLAEIQNAGGAQTVLMTGHNPGMQMLAMMLSGGAETDSANGAAARLLEKFSSGAAAVLETESAWRDLRPGGAKLAMFVRPKDLDPEL